MTISLQRNCLIAGLSLLLLSAGYCGYRVHRLSSEQKMIKKDYSIVNNISFGLLSVNKWRDLLVSSVSRRIEYFDLGPEERDSLEKEVEHILYGLVDKVDSLMDAPQKSLGGKLRKLAFHAFVKEDKLRQLVPSFSRKIMQELTKPSSERKLKYLAVSKLKDLGEDTYDSSRRAEKKSVDSIYRKYGVADDRGFDEVTATRLAGIRHTAYSYTYGIIGVTLLALSLWYLLRRRRKLYVSLYILSILIALVLLLTGLTTVMIEIDARIKSIDFHLLGEAISFRDQVIFFQSKSIVDVVAILMETGRYDSILVGLLILCFSIFFPVVKLLSAGIYLLGRKSWMKGRVVKYFAFHSGKWSMADVTVVAIFMAYIGFNGILDSQMSSLNQRSENFTSIATNQTSLQPGYIIFVLFVLYGLVLSQILKRITAKEQETGEG